MKTLLVLLVTFTFTTGAFAFTPFRSWSTTRQPILRLPAQTDPPTSAPFDGGLSLLVAAGLAYSGKRAYNKMKPGKTRGAK